MRTRVRHPTQRGRGGLHQPLHSALNIARRVREGLEARSRPVDKGLRSSILFKGDYPYNVDSPEPSPEQGVVMKSRILPLIAVLGCAVAVLSSCGGGGVGPCVETMPGMTMCPDRLYPSPSLQSTQSTVSHAGQSTLVQAERPGRG